MSDSEKDFSIIKGYESSIDKKGKLEYKTLSDIEIASANVDLEVKIENKSSRKFLSRVLLWTSIIWLSFSAAIIFLIGKGCLHFHPSVATSFVIGSLAEVFGLWKISLDYFFERNKH